MRSTAAMRVAPFVAVGVLGFLVQIAALAALTSLAQLDRGCRRLWSPWSSPSFTTSSGTSGGRGSIGRPRIAVPVLPPMLECSAWFDFTCANGVDLDRRKRGC